MHFVPVHFFFKIVEVSTSLIFYILDLNLILIQIFVHTACSKIIERVLADSNESNEVFKEKMETFIADATTRLQAKFEKLETSREVFMQTLIFYKFTPKTGTMEECTPAQFFELWTPFTHDFRDIWIKEINMLHQEL